MMEHAGRGLAEAVQRRYAGRPPCYALGLVGSGNNGGDTLVALDYLAQWGWQVRAYLVRPRPQDDPLVQRFVGAGGLLASWEDDAQHSRLLEWLAESTVLLDGVFGTGIRLPLRGAAAEALSETRRILARFSHRPVVVAVDCPSGVDCDSGAAAPECLRADLTVTMAAVKSGLLAFPAAKFTGELELVGIGLEEFIAAGHALEAWQSLQNFVVEAAWVKAHLPPRPADAHKGTFGTALLAAGSVNYTGAAWLAGQAAYRCGAGLVTLAVPAPLHAALAGVFPEATWIPLPHEGGFVSGEAAAVLQEGFARATALLVGPGFGLEASTAEFVTRLLKIENLPPLVFDADGLRLLARLPDWHKRLPGTAVLTPHPGEMAALTGLGVPEIQANRLDTARDWARRWEHVVILKGAFTLVAAPDGRTAVIPVASSALARAGSGDVLAGLVVGLRAQGLAAFEAAATAAWLHAECGQGAARRLGSTAAVLAGDVLAQLPAVLAALENM
jgi:NAD(P)H-hydrate epimerase